MSDPLINGLGVAVITFWVAFVVVLGICNVLYQQRRSKVFTEFGSKGFGKDLLFHSPDDEPRSFKQFGFRRSVLGSVMLNAWVFIFVVGYFYMVLFTWLVYAPRFGAPTFALTAFGGWNGLMGPWVVVFTATHVIGMVLILTWEATRTRFMMPVPSLGDASHVMIEEDVSYDTDEALEDPDSLEEGLLHRFRQRAAEARRKFQKAKRRTVLPVALEADGTRRIEYTCVRYVYDEEDERFNPTGIASFTAAGVHEKVRLGGNSEAVAQETMATCGRNEINVHVPSVLEALLREFADFTYIFNSIGTWSYMVYSAWNIGIFWLMLTLSSGIFRSLFIVRPNQKKIHELAQLHTKCQVLRGGQWRTIEASELVLGDVIRVEDGSEKLPCDGVVIQGSLVVNESMLTGEPMPVQKMPVEDSQHATITKKNTAYAGTTCLQSSGPQDGKALLLATAVGALTTRGQLVRMVLFPTSVRFKYNDQLPTVYGIICGYMVILCAIYLSPLVNLHSWVATYLFLVNTIAMCLSPMLPVSMVMGQTVTAKRLQNEHKIGCLQPGRIPIAGKISTMVFDKTGTITKDGMDFDAVIPVEGGAFGTRVQFNPDAEDDDAARTANQATVQSQVPLALRHALASCHTVTTLRDGTLVGNQVEVSMVKTAGWQIKEDAIVSPTGDQSLEIVKKLDFDHCRMTSGVVVRCSETQELKVYIKGSYEKIQAISEPSSVPRDYEALTQQCAKDGYYVLGIASKQLPQAMTKQELADMTRDSLEAGLSICGLLLFRNEMKPDSPDAIHELQKGAVRSVICTGDNALTGISIGRKCGIVAEQRKVLLGNLTKAGVLEWRDPDIDDGAAVNVATIPSAQLAVTQGAWRYLLKNGRELDAIWTRLVVFARMKPEDKINVVKYFQSKHLVVGMCGDGGNDCGGLRAAHAGLALSDAEASMVSPFATGRDGKSLMTVVDLIREGRACLSTNLATFQYFILYCFTITTIRTIFAVNGALNFGEYVWLTYDVGVGILFVWTMTQSRPTAELCNYRPTATLLGLRTISAIAFPYFTALVAVIVAECLLWAQSWYVFLEPITDLHLLPSQWMLRGDNYDSSLGMIAIMIALVNTAYVNTYGGSFRQNILWNWKINVVYAFFMFGVFFLLLAGPTQFNCIFRVNCDTKHSLEARDLTLLALFSEGGVGGCFMGPQLQIWQEQVAAQGYGPDWWLPEAKEQCLPPAGYSTTPLSSPEISKFGCVGPNNCYSEGYRWEAAFVFLCYILINHAFVKFALQGPVAHHARQRQRRSDPETVGEIMQPTSTSTSSDPNPSTETSRPWARSAQQRQYGKPCDNRSSVPFQSCLDFVRTLSFGSSTAFKPDADVRRF